MTTPTPPAEDLLEHAVEIHIGSLSLQAAVEDAVDLAERLVDETREVVEEYRIHGIADLTAHRNFRDAVVARDRSRETLVEVLRQGEETRRAVIAVKAEIARLRSQA